MRRIMLILGAATAAGLAACGDATGPGNATGEDREEVLAVLDESGWFTEDFGVEGAAMDASLASGLSLSLTGAQDTVDPVRRWGRRRGRPAERDITINVADDTARVTAVVSFDGTFLLDRTDDGQANPTEKPLQEQAVHRAVLVRRGEPDSAGRRWRLVQLSPWEWRMTDEARRTVRVTSVEVLVNGDSKILVEDPAELFDVDHRIPRLRLGDVVQVIATVENTTGHDHEPPTFVFLHVYHASPAARAWIRLPMPQDDEGRYVREWTVRFPGRERIAVDAIDSQTFNTDSDDDYRANVWGIPYRIE
jgi:hypothetical protein